MDPSTATASSLMQNTVEGFFSVFTGVFKRLEDVTKASQPLFAEGGALQSILDQATDTVEGFAEKITPGLRELSRSVDTFGKNIGTFLSDALEGIKPDSEFRKAFGEGREAFGELGATFAEIGEVFGKDDLFGSAFGKIDGFFGKVEGFFGRALNSVEAVSSFTTRISNAVNSVSGIVDPALEAIGSLSTVFSNIGASIGSLGGLFSKAGEQSGELGGLLSRIFSFFDPAGFFGKIFEGLKLGFGGIFGEEGLFGKLTGTFGNILTAGFEGAGSLLKSVFSTLFSGAAGSGGGGGIFGFLGSVASALFLSKGGVVGAHGSMALERYATGGVARTRQLAMFGEGSLPEAFVPLPDGRSIPVSLAGGGGTVNASFSSPVTVNLGGSSSTAMGNPDQARELGTTISRAVRGEFNELLRQATRPGGALNPQGFNR